MELDDISPKLINMPIIYRNFGSITYAEDAILVDANARQTPGYPHGDFLSRELLIKLRDPNINCSYPAYCSTAPDNWNGNPMNTKWIVIPKGDFKALQHPEVKDLINLTQNKLYYIIKNSDKPYILKSLSMHSETTKLSDLDINMQHKLYLNNLFQTNFDLFDYIVDVIKDGYYSVSNEKKHSAELLLYCKEYYLIKVSTIKNLVNNFEELNYTTLLRICKKI